MTTFELGDIGPAPATPSRRRRSARSGGGAAHPRSRATVLRESTDLTKAEADSWCDSVAGWSAEPNPFMKDKVEQIISDMPGAGSRHAYARTKLLSLGFDAVGGDLRDDGTVKPGNPGGAWALTEVATVFAAAIHADRPRTAEHEAERLVLWAIGVVAAEVASGKRQPSGEMFGDGYADDIEPLDEESEAFLNSLNGVAADPIEADDSETASVQHVEGPDVPPLGELFPAIKTAADGDMTEAAATEVSNVPTPSTAAATSPKVTGSRTSGATLAGGVTEGDFWKARPILEHLETFALSRRVAPWALLGVVIVQTLAQVPPTCQLPALIGSRGSLNAFVALVGTSGEGKGTATQAAREALPWTNWVEPRTPGSGEGVVRLFAYRKPGVKGTPSTVERTAWSAILDIAEIDTLAAFAGRAGSSYLPELRKCFSGEPIGRVNNTADRSVDIDRHSYRLGAIVGVQPTRAGVLMEDADGGTPQRFLWLPAGNPNSPRAKPAEPAPRTNPLHPDITTAMWKLKTTGNTGDVVEVAVPAKAAEEVDFAAWNRHRGVTTGLNGHALFVRLKTAAALAFLDGRTYLNDDDWTLAEVVMSVSDRTRADVQKALRDAAHAETVSRGRAQGIATVAAEEVHETATAHRVSRSILNALDGGAWCPASDLRKKLSSRYRAHFDTAIETLKATGRVEVAPAPSGRGEQFRLPVK